MKTIKIQKAKKLLKADTIHDVQINILDKGDLEDDKYISLEETNKYFYEEAKKLSVTLLTHLPQGLLEPLIIQLLISKVSSYYGPITQPLDSELIELIENAKQTIDISFNEVDKWKIEDIHDNVFVGNTIREALINMKIFWERFNTNSKPLPGERNE